MSIYKHKDINYKHKELITVLKEGVQFELVQPFRFYFEDPTPTSIHKLPFGIVKLNAMNGCLYIEVPADFKTDFGTIPLLFQSVISPIGKPTKSFVVHDYLCVLAHSGKCSRKLADRVFLDCMRIQGVSPLKRNVIYYAVRAFALLKGLK